MAVAWRRRAKGSSDPVGTMPTWKNAARLSKRSATTGPARDGSGNSDPPSNAADNAALMA